MSFFVARSLEEWKSGRLASRETAISVGNFDGLHLGHQKILRSLAERAKKNNLAAAVITFDPHPMKVLRPQNAPLLIETLEQRLKGFERLGLDAALVLHFDAELANVSAENFIERILVSTVHAREILVGENFRFGHKHAGDVHLLERSCARHAFSVEIVAPALIDGHPVSSTRVRQAVGEGNVEEAERLLGRHFALTGVIIRGAGRGSKVVFPTLNLSPDQELLPARGVYATRALFNGAEYGAVTNVGVRPTFNGTGLTVESHLLDFSESVQQGR
ncbi:MAG TPA: bifunctional riboflavin kinase/FAD synthetase, partial [Candidatus Acidoferrales bacterium]|nr:bifunctional riboflavin kinase/FAD synthetase [Candidatus Acidoferrales bacterium]